MDIRERIAGKLRDLVATPLDRGFRRGTVMAIASSKGGVGKTTTAVNLAIAYAEQGVRVLLLDLDPQAHVAASLQATPQPEGLVADVLLGKKREVCEVATNSAWPQLDLAGSDKTLAETEMVLSAKIGKELLLSGALHITRSRYDLIIIDCPPNLGTLTLNALCAADRLLIPADMSVLALEGVSDILKTVETLRLRLQRTLEDCRILTTRFDKRASQLNQTLTASFQELYGEMLLDTAIPQNAAINRAHASGDPVYRSAPKSPGALAYLKLASELAPILGLVAHTPASPETLRQTA